MSGEVHVSDHPLIQHKLTRMRDVATSTVSFRTLLEEIGMLMAYEATRDLALADRSVETPLAPMTAPALAGKKPALVAVLRAGIGLLDGLLRVVPEARVGHVGMYRDAETLEAIEYYSKLPPDLDQRDVLMVDPMLATGNTAIASVERVKQAAPRTLRFVSLLAAPEGIARFHERHGDVPVFTAAVDDHLNDHGYIVPGLGDAGDRMYGTK